MIPRLINVLIINNLQFEECGTCDEEGNIQITKTFIEPAKTKKVVARTKQKAIDKRSNIINNQRSQKLIGSSIQKGRPIKAAISSPVKNLGNPINQCKVEKCQSKSILCSNCSLIEFARSKDKTKENFNQTCDINGNLRDSLDQSFLHEHFKKNCVQHDQSNAILPAISTYLTYLNKGKRLKNFKWNDVQRYSNEALHSIENFAKNLTNAPCDLVNKCKLECSCQCRFHANNSFNVSKLPTNKLQSVWNPTDGLMTNFSETLKIASENDNKNCVSYDQRNIYKNEHVNPAENNVHHMSNNFSNSQPFNESNHHRFSNCYQYTNYYQNFGINNGEQNNGTFVQYPNQNSGYNLQSGREFSLRQESNLGHFSQQFPSTDVNQMTINQNFNWFSPELLPMEIYRREPGNIPDISNRILNDCKYMNNHHAIKSSQQQSNESFFSPVSKFEGRFSFENPINSINSSLYPKNAIYAESKPQFGENFRRL